jgi:two-component system response regulator YesN
LEDDYVVFLLRTWGKAAASEGDRELEALLLLQTARERVEAQGYVFPGPGGHITGVLTDGNHRGLFLSLHKALERAAGRPCVLGVGVTVAGLSNIGESYAYARQAAARPLLAGEAGVFYGDIAPQPPRAVPPPDPAPLLGALAAADRPAALEAARRLAEGLQGPEGAEAYYTAGVLEIFHAYFSRGPEALTLIEEFQTGLTVCESLPDMHGIFRTKLEGYLDMLASGKGENRIIAQVKDLIDRDYGKNLTLQEIARRVYLSINYLCTLFKQQTGMTVNDYLTRRRITEAKGLLAAQGLKLYEVAERVGYQDQKYFSKLFRRMTGHSPSEYRKERLRP